MKKKYLFLDRDGTLLIEPSDQQIDSLEKFSLLPNVIPSLLKLKARDFTFVMVTNQDGLGKTFAYEKFFQLQTLLINLLASQGIVFEDILICSHIESDGCACRKPKLGLMMKYLVDQTIDKDNSFMIGDRETDKLFAENLGVNFISINQSNDTAWRDITRDILKTSRKVSVSRKTNETEVSVQINLDEENNSNITTGIAFFDHMLEQLAKHGGFSMRVNVKGDLEVDDHHTVEDTAIVIATAIDKALGNKMGIARYGFLLPMDDALTQIALDICGRSYFVFNGQFSREKVGQLATELVPHFFRSFAETFKATLHMKVTGDNNHHMIESLFKCFGRVLRQAIKKIDTTMPSTKGVL